MRNVILIAEGEVMVKVINKSRDVYILDWLDYMNTLKGFDKEDTPSAFSFRDIAQKGRRTSCS